VAIAILIFRPFCFCLVDIVLGKSANKYRTKINRLEESRGIGVDMKVKDDITMEIKNKAQNTLR
jgi:hypothetical protein